MKTLSNIREHKLKYANWFLAAAIILINGYVAAYPFFPQLELWRRKHQTAAVAGLPYKTKLDKTPAKDIKRSAIPSDNRLIIPSLALNQHIYTGPGTWHVNLGVWAQYSNSTPPQGGNTVIIAHRFTYKGPSIFYSLGDLRPGDKAIIYWQGKEYDYTVMANRIVPATDLSVESPSSIPELTLYTCTPLWTAEPKNRIVVTASLDGN